MFREVSFVITLIIITSAKVVLSYYGDDNNLDRDQSDSKNIYSNDFRYVGSKEKIWVLELNDEGLDTLKLREPNAEDEEDFEFYTEPLIKSYKRQHSNVVKKDAPKPATVSDVKKTIPRSSVSKKDIFKYLNKFALYSKIESDGNLSDPHEDDDASIALYFKDRFTSLIVKQGIRQWHYFFPPPSILPAWFYEDLSSNASGGTITVPDDVAEKFYPALFRLLQALLRNPV